MYCSIDFPINFYKPNVWILPFAANPFIYSWFTNIYYILIIIDKTNCSLTDRLCSNSNHKPTNPISVLNNSHSFSTSWYYCKFNLFTTVIQLNKTVTFSTVIQLNKTVTFSTVILLNKTVTFCFSTCLF